MQIFLAQTVAGIATYGCVYALTALGLVVTYTTSGIFNFAQGAIGMMGAFLFWQFEVDYGWPAWAAFIVVALVIAPLAGALLELGLMRRVAHASLEAKLTVTVGLLLFLIALATTLWNPDTARQVVPFFAGDQITVGGVVLSYQQLIVVGVAILVAIGLRLFFYVTRPGIATRAVVDNRELSMLVGARPNLYSMFGWALGSSLAVIAGILLAPTVNLNIVTLTLLVVNGYAAAMVGRLSSLPWTFVGAIILGLLEAYATQYLPVGQGWSIVVQILPMIFLFVVILVVPQMRASLGQRTALRHPRVASLKESVVTAVIFLIIAVVVSQVLSTANLAYADAGVGLGIIFLSLLLLTGYGGQVSLCQMTFAGLGAYAMAKVGGSGGSLLGILAAVGLAAGVGAVIALPALRLRGLYLALATLAFAYAMDTAFFSNPSFFGTDDSLFVARPNIFGLSLASNGSYLIVLSVVFAAVGVGSLALRRGRYGRRLLAMSDSPAACTTLGVGITGTKLALFTVSAGLAGLGGALYGGALGSVAGGANGDFTFLLSLTVLLLAVVWGIRTVGGMLLAGVSLALGPLIQQHISTPRDVVYLVVGLAAVGIAQNPEGTFGGATPLQRLRDRRAAEVSRLSPDASVEESQVVSGATS
jgi:branched-chain amino acid transport system permease protein